MIAAASATGCGGGGDAAEPSAEPPAAAGPAVTVPLAAERKSGLTGTATLRSATGTTFEVVLEVPKAKDGSAYPAHVHRGTCADYRKLKTFNEQLASVSDELQDVVEGRSESTVYAALAERLTGGYSINVHEGTGTYPAVACGDIPAR